MAKAKKPKQAPKRPRRRRGSGDSNAFGILFIILLVVLGFINMNAAMLLTLGLLPTVVLGFTGKGDNKTQRMLSVAFANGAGVVVLFVDVWNSPSVFESLIMSPNTWVIMWGAAVIGYALNYVGPMIAAMIMQGLAQDRIKNINQQKQELVELWGHEVLGGKDDDKPDLGMSSRRPIR